MVVVIQPGFSQLARLFLGQLAQGHAGLQAKLAHAFDHFQDVGHILVGRVLPGRAHAKAGCANGFGGDGFIQDLLDFQQLFLVQPGVVVTRLRAVLAVFRAGTSLDRQ